MKTVKYESASFSDESERKLTVAMWQDRIDFLVSAMQTHGTEVLANTTTITSPDSPQNVSRDAVYRFIFPPQEVVLEIDDRREIQTSSGIERHKQRTRQFDTSKVRGHLHLEYGDSFGRIKFMLMDYLDDSEVPREVLDVIADTIPEAISEGQ